MASGLNFDSLKNFDFENDPYVLTGDKQAQYKWQADLLRRISDSFDMPVHKPLYQRFQWKYMSELCQFPQIFGPSFDVFNIQIGDPIFCRSELLTAIMAISKLNSDVNRLIQILPDYSQDKNAVDMQDFKGIGVKIHFNGHPRICKVDDLLLYDKEEGRIAHS
jgi:hypothetical protein